MEHKNSNSRRHKRSGWHQLKKENETGFQSNFMPIRKAIRRSELLGSIVELFVSAIIGVSKLNLGAKAADKLKQEP